MANDLCRFLFLPSFLMYFSVSLMMECIKKIRSTVHLESRAVTTASYNLCNTKEKDLDCPLKELKKKVAKRRTNCKSPIEL